VDFADYAAAAEDVARQFRREAARPDPIRFFAYPKGNGSFRSLCLPSVKDLVLLRAAAGYMALATERALADIPSVYSGRLARGVPDWRFRAKPYERFRKDAAKRAKQWGCQLMVRTDVRSYYPSIDIARLAVYLLADLRCRYGPTAFYLERILHWQQRQGLKGLPVGPEASHVPGTAFLKPVDVAMLPLTDGYFRYTDDIVYFVADPGLGDLLSTLDASLGERGLMRGMDKTEVHDDPIAAREAIDRRLFASLSNGLSSRSPLAMRAVKREFIRDVVEGQGNARDFRWYIQVFANRGDPFAVRWLVSDWDRFNIDPRKSSDYVASCGLDDPEVVGRAMERLSASNADTMSGTELHLLRVFSQVETGNDERRLFEKVAMDSSRPIDVRSWAWMAAASAAGFGAEAAAEAAVEESDPAIRRAIVLSLRGKTSRSRNWALKDVARKHPDAAVACAWALAA